MAIAGSGGWIPSNQIRLRDGQLQFCSITQNKPSSVCESDPATAARRLLAGETVTMDIRYPFVTQVRYYLFGEDSLFGDEQ